MKTKTETRYVVAVVPYGQTWDRSTQIERLNQSGINPKYHTCGVWGPNADAELGVYFSDLESALVQAVDWQQKAIWIAHIDAGSPYVQGYCLDLHTDNDSYETEGKLQYHITVSDYTEFRDIIVG